MGTINTTKEKLRKPWRVYTGNQKLVYVLHHMHPTFHSYIHLFILGRNQRKSFKKAKKNKRNNKLLKSYSFFVSLNVISMISMKDTAHVCLPVVFLYDTLNFHLKSITISVSVKFFFRISTWTFTKTYHFSILAFTL